MNRADGLSSEDLGWLPVRSFDGRGVRRRRGSRPAIYVVPSADVLVLAGERGGAPCPSALTAPAAAGACLVIGPSGGPLAVRCWTIGEIERGRALALVGGDAHRVLVGLAPTGHSLVLKTDAGPVANIRSTDGVVDQPIRLAADTPVRFTVSP